MGLGRYKATLETLAKEYVEMPENKRELNIAYARAVNFINTSVGDNVHARGYLLNYYCDRVKHYRSLKNGNESGR